MLHIEVTRRILAIYLAGVCSELADAVLYGVVACLCEVDRSWSIAGPAAIPLGCNSCGNAGDANKDGAKHGDRILLVVNVGLRVSSFGLSCFIHFFSSHLLCKVPFGKILGPTAHVIHIEYPQFAEVRVPV